MVSTPGFYELNKIDKTEPEIWDKLMNINAKSVFLVCKSIIPYMKLRKRLYCQYCFNVSSRQRRAKRYCASKFAVVGLTESLRS